MSETDLVPNVAAFASRGQSAQPNTMKTTVALESVLEQLESRGDAKVRAHNVKRGVAGKRSA